MKTEFNHFWTFLMTCLYYQVSPAQVTAKHPIKAIARVKKIASYLIYTQGASGRQAGEVIGLDTHTVRDHVNEIRDRISKNDRLRNEIRDLKRLTAKP